MSRLPGILLRWLCLLPMAVLAEAMVSEFWRGLRAQGLSPATLGHPLVLACAGGFAFRFLFHALWKRLGKDDPLEFIDTLEHELTHAMMGYLTFAPPVSLSASLKSGGEVQLKGANPLAALAPYFLPLWVFAALLLGLVVRPGMQEAWRAGVFFLLGGFAYRLSREYRWRQTDLHLYGFLFSTLAVALLFLMSLGLILKASGLLSWAWLGNVWPHARSMASAVSHFLAARSGG